MNIPADYEPWVQWLYEQVLAPGDYCVDVGASVYRVSYATPAEAGLLGEYFSENDLTGERTTRVDATIAFDWFGLAPAPGMPADGFSVRYTGEVEPEFDESYTFSVDTEDDVRLWVDDVLLVEQPSGPSSGTIALEADRRYPLRLEFVENTGSARVVLNWESPSQPLEVVPSDRLHPPDSAAEQRQSTR